MIQRRRTRIKKAEYVFSDEITDEMREEFVRKAYRMEAIASQKVIKGDFYGALGVYTQLCEFVPSCATVFSTRGLLLASLGQIDRAIADLHTALKLEQPKDSDPSDPDSEKSMVTFNLAECYRENKDYDNAIKYFDKAIQQFPNNGHLWYRKALVYHDMKELDKAIEHLDVALSDNKDIKETGRFYQSDVLLDENELRGEVHKVRCRCLGVQEKYDEAMPDAHKAVQLCKDTYEPLLHRATLFSIHKEYELALTDVNRAIEMKPKAWLGYKCKAGIFGEKGDFEAALKQNAIAISLNKKDIELHVERSHMHHLNNDYHSAVASINDAIKIDKKDPDLFKRRASYYAKLAEIDRLDAAKLDGYDSIPTW